MLTLPSTVSGYVMARSTGYEGTVASSMERGSIALGKPSWFPGGRRR